MPTVRPVARMRSGQFVDERALAGAWRPGDADEERAAGPCKDAANEIGAGRRLVFDERDGAGDGAGIPRENAVGQRALGHSRAFTEAAAR